MSEDKLQLLMQHLGYQFQDVSLLKQALLHRSISNQHNERLEFLGDTALSLAIASELFQRSPALSEGEMTQMRSALVCGSSLAALARQLDVAAFLQCVASEKRRDSVLEDAFEAIIGAVYCDGGLSAVRQCVVHCFAEKLRDIKPTAIVKDAKTQLQEWLQAQAIALPTYTIEVTGPAHARRFRATCQVAGYTQIQGSWQDSRRAAEKSAAHVFLEKYHD